MTAARATADGPPGPGGDDARGTALDVSVVIAARDAEATLPAQLAALADQDTRCSWEVLVADNGSTDRTRDVVLDAARRTGRVRLVDASAIRGAGAARNEAARVARGGALLFCDADDVVAPGWVDALHAALRGSDLVAGRLEWERLNSRAAQGSRALPQVDGLQHTEPLPGLGCASSSNLAVRRTLFDRLGGFDVRARYLQDTDLCWRAQLAGGTLAFEPAAVVHMRLRPGLVGAWRQGRGTGMGQRWLAARYAEVAAAQDAVASSERPVGRGCAEDGAGAQSATRLDGPEAPDPASGSAGGGVGEPGRRWPARIARRAWLVVGEAARIRSRGDAARLSWSTGFGIGYARGGLPDPEPLRVEEPVCAGAGADRA